MAHFVSYLSNSDERVRLETVTQLGRSKSPRAVDPLAATLAGDASPQVRDAAAKALGLIGSPTALPALNRAVQADSVRRRLLHERLTPGAVEAIGPCWPDRNGQARRSPLLAPLRGAWMLVASKQRAVLTPLHRPALRRVTPQPSLAVPSRRVRA